ncbi:hypothetical protein [Maribacter polysaccharolyticus]|uniref:hypothetical protein n=1 Tax=Maribacter polysaccharolyticus TaxID=3020831 RepID=UPI00237FCD69|nr:hypothetical protein [Maribacter polysaccharolyticus]MDE3742321.1 hypothetical protein [Maribacter polysaccharolyticus]
MVNKNVILVLLFFMVILSCKDKRNTEIKSVVVDQSTDSLGCFAIKEREIILNKILATDDLQTYLKPLQERSLPLEIVINKFITPDLRIRTNGQDVILRDSSSKIERTFEFSFPNIDCEKQILGFSVWYEFEHANIVGIVRKLNEKWAIEIIGHGIVD